MTQVTFSGAAGTITNLNQNFDQLYNLREFISTVGYTAASEALRCDGTSNWLFNRSGASINNTAGWCVAASGLAFGETDDACTLFLNRFNGDGVIQTFRRENVTVGSISVTGSATTYATSSDRRLKRQIEPLAGAVRTLQAIQWRQFEFLADPGVPVVGVIADELQAVYPLAVVGEPGGEEMQAVDLSKLVPIIGAALQDALQQIAQLRGEIAELRAG
jgi:hypothetical protein